MLALKDHGYTEQERKDCKEIFAYLSEMVCNYCCDNGHDKICFHYCPYSHIIADLERVTKINKK